MPLPLAVVAPERPLDDLVAQALDTAYLGQLSDVGRDVLLGERNRPDPEAAGPEPEPENKGFFTDRLPPPGWKRRDELMLQQRHDAAVATAAVEAAALAAEAKEAASFERWQRGGGGEPEPEPQQDPLNPQPPREPPGGGLKAAYRKLLASGQVAPRGGDGGAVGAALAELGQKVLGAAQLRLEHRRRAADLRNAQLVANTARSKEQRLRSEAVGRAKQAHAATLASARYTSYRPASWQHGDGGGGDAAAAPWEEDQSWRNIPYETPVHPGVAQVAFSSTTETGRSPADAALLVSGGVQAMAQKREQANRLVVTEKRGDTRVQIHRMQPVSTAETAAQGATQTRMRAHAARLRQTVAPCSPRTARLQHTEAVGGCARSSVNNAGGLEVKPGLNGTTTVEMTLRDGEHRPLAAQYMSHSLQPTPPQKPPTPRARPASRVLVSSATEMAVSPGPAAYHSTVAYTCKKTQATHHTAISGGLSDAFACVFSPPLAALLRPQHSRVRHYRLTAATGTGQSLARCGGGAGGCDAEAGAGDGGVGTRVGDLRGDELDEPYGARQLLRAPYDSKLDLGEARSRRS